MAHYCDTDNPTRPCCRKARELELAESDAMDALRISTHGRTSCADCGKVYAVDHDWATDTYSIPEHACRPLTADQALGR